MFELLRIKSQFFLYSLELEFKVTKSCQYFMQQVFIITYFEQSWLQFNMVKAGKVFGIS